VKSVNPLQAESFSSPNHRSRRRLRDGPAHERGHLRVPYSPSGVS